MSITKLHIQRFRCISEARIEFGSEENLIYGANASGKTTLLETLFFLGHGRSFRGTRQRSLVQDQEKDFILFASLIDPDGKIGIKVDNTGLTAKIDGSRAHSRSSLVSRLPVQVIEPGIHKLIEEGPEQRRRYLDWGVFHVEQLFYTTWRRYKKALDQRNASLKERIRGSEAEAWEDTLISAGEAVNQQRFQYLDKLKPFLVEAGNALFGSPLECRFSQGWPEEMTLSEAMSANHEKDRKLFRTHAGPHRADIKIRFQDKMARTRVSRGQQKLLAAGLVLAQLDLFANEKDKSAILLIDDPAAELDPDSLNKLLNYARKIPAQRFISSLDKDLISMEKQTVLFHVEHGVVQKVL